MQKQNRRVSKGLRTSNGRIDRLEPRMVMADVAGNLVSVAGLGALGNLGDNGNVGGPNVDSPGCGCSTCMSARAAESAVIVSARTGLAVAAAEWSARDSVIRPLTRETGVERFWRPLTDLPATISSNAKRAATRAVNLAGVDTAEVGSDGAVDMFRARAMAPFRLDLGSLRSTLRNAPTEETIRAGGVGMSLFLPAPDGTFERFAVWRSEIMEPGLAARFSSIRTYAGQSLDDPGRSVRFDVSQQGLRAMATGGETGTYYIDPLYLGDNTLFASYARADAIAPSWTADWTCAVIDPATGLPVTDVETAEDGGTGGTASRSPIGPAETTVVGTSVSLRTYRLAVAATGEYTSFHGGTVAAGQAAIVTAVNRINQVYETEFAARLTLVANNSNLVYTNSGTDPYTNNDGITLLGQNQTNVDAVIGNANYDLGHVFSTGGGGVAGLGVLGLTGSKARGVTGSGSPTGDAFWIDYVAHEMGHQFGANHTFNSPNSGSNRNGSTAYEPGSASTIMSYAGLMGADDLQLNSDPYFHAISIVEARNIMAARSSTGVFTATGNTSPSVDAGGTFTIPASTPFQLTATGSDANGDTVTYDWQQYDVGGSRNLSQADNGASPLFRVYNPTTSPTRTFPRLSTILSGQLNTPGLGNSSTNVAERTYTSARTTSNWRVIARDNRAGGGGVTIDSTSITVVNTGAGFAVTAPNTAVSWVGGSTQNFTWNVAGTGANGINTANVRILLSTNGGNTFPTVISASTANDGLESLTLPNIPTTTARIRIEAVGNIFFDISNVNFTITDGGLPQPPAAPGTPTLDAASDTGSSNSDRITRLNNSSTGNRLSFTVPGTVSGATVRLLSGTTLLGTAVASGTTTTVLTNGTTALPDGPYAITAEQVLTGLTSSTSGSVAVTIDATAPTLTGGVTDYGIRNTGVGAFPLTFSESISGLSTSNFTLVRDGAAVTTPGETVTGGGTSWQVAGVTTESSVTGVYTLDLASPSSVSDVAGNALSTAAGPIATFAVNVITVPNTAAENLVRIAPVSSSLSLLNIWVNSPTPTYTSWAFSLGQELRIVGVAGANRVRWEGGNFLHNVDLRFTTLSGTGTLEAATGTLVASGSVVGAVDAAAGARLELGAAQSGTAVTIGSGGSLLLRQGANSTFSSVSAASGRIETAGANLTLPAGANVGELVVAGGASAASTVGFTGAATVGTLRLNANGRADLPAGMSAGTLDLAGGTLAVASGVATISGSAAFTSGTILGPGTVAFSAGLTLSSTSAKAVDGAAVSLAGSVSWTGGVISLTPSASLNVTPGSVFTVASGAAMTASGGAGGRINNAGLIRGNSGTSTWASGLTLDNTGTVEVASGALRIDGPVVQLAGATLTGGAYIVRAGSTLQLASASAVSTLAASVTLEGSGSNLVRNVSNNALLALNTVAATGQLSISGRTFALSVLSRLDGALTLGPSTLVTVTPALALAGSVSGTAGSTVTFSGAVNLSGAVSSGGRLTFNQPLTGTGSATVAAGGLLTAPRIDLGSLDVAGRANLTLGGAVSVLGALRVANDGAPLGTRVYSGLLDLNAGSLVLRNTPAADARDFVRGWWAGGARTGGGVGSSLSGGSGRDAYATVGVRSPASPFGFLDFAAFSGVPVTAADMVFKYTYFGDTDLDGALDARDFNAVVSGFSNAPVGADWTRGDTDADGNVDTDDLSRFLSAYDNQTLPFA